MSWMGKRNAAKREAQRVKDTADIVAEGWAPPLTAHDARMATGEDGCNSPGHDHSRELTDAEVDAALYAQQKDPVPDAGQGGEVGYYEPGGEGERRAKAFWDHGLPPVEEFEREIYTRLDAETGRSWTTNWASPREWTYEEVNGAMEPAVYPATLVTFRAGPALQVRQVSHAPTGGLEGLICQAIVRAHREREARREQLRERFGCSQPPWAREYVRTGRVRQADREVGG